MREYYFKMEGKNRVKTAYQQTVENRVKTAQEEHFNIKCLVVSTKLCAEIDAFMNDLKDFHNGAVEKDKFCG
jgi:hypothetical protein